MKKYIIFLALTGAMILILCGTVSAAELSSNRHVFVNVANDNGVKYDMDGAKYSGPSDTYYIKADGGGLNELHITNSNDVNSAYGQISVIDTTSSSPSGVFYVSNTGGRGFDNDIILLVSVKGPIPDNFSMQITTSGYTWTPATPGAYNPSPPTDYQYVPVGISETFTKADFIYGPQVYKPGPGTLGVWSLPLYYDQNTGDPSTAEYLMFIDLYVGNIKAGVFSDLVDNGAVKVQYTINNVTSHVSFNAYGWCSAANQDEGINWTNQPSGSTASGYSINYTPLTSTPVADFTASPIIGTVPLIVQFADKSTGSPTSWAWDFDNDGIVDSTAQSPTYTYNKSGDFTVKLSVSNTAGSDEELKSNYINVTDRDVTPPTVSADLDSGNYNSDKSVILTANDDHDPTPKIYYTTNGSTPTTNSTLYTAPIVLSSEGFYPLKFISVDASLNTSDVVTMNYRIDKTPPTVTSNPAGGTFNTAQNINLVTTDTSTTNTYYTRDGSDPKTSSTRTLYFTPISINDSITLKYAAIDAADNWSQVYTQNYTISTSTKTVQNTRTGTTYSTIQDAINTAITGDTIKVGSKTYTENVTIDKQLNLLAQGQVTVKPSSVTNPVFTILDSGAGSTVDGFTITGATNSHGISIEGFCNITNNIITNNGLDGVNIVGGNPNITENTITNNSRDGVSINSGSATINFNRILKNTRYGLYMVSGGAVVADCKNNWWGTNSPSYMINNTNPPANGTAIYDKHNGNAHVTYNPWAVLTVTATPNVVKSGVDSIIKADLTHDNNGNLITGGQIPDGAHINFTSDLGSINPASTDLSNNTATATLNINSTSGTAHVNITVDDYTTNTPVIIDNIAPTITVTPAGGTFDTSVNVTLTTTDANSKTTYYTTDGSDPKASNTRIVYTGPVTIGSTKTLKYIAVDQADNWSSSYTQTYTIRNPDTTAPTATANPVGGTFNNPQSITLSSNDSTATIYYTTDGSDPKVSTTRATYSNPIQINDTTTLRYIAVDPAGNWSPQYTQTYNINNIDNTPPTVTSSVPASNATSVSLSSPVSISFSEDVVAGANFSGVYIKNTVSGAVVSIASKVISGNVLTITQTNPRKLDTLYKVYIPSGAVKDAAGNSLSSAYTYNFSTGTGSTDTTSPTITGTNPANMATGVSLISPVSISFSEDVVAGANFSGVYIKNTVSGAVVSIASKVISGNVLTISQTNPRKLDTLYKVYIPSGAVKDAVGNSLSSAYTYNFSTGTGSSDSTPPTVTSSVPTGNATGVSLSSPVSISFSENIVAGDNYSGIYVKNTVSGAVVSIASKVISGNVLTISQTNPRKLDTLYKVYIPSGAVKDAAGNSLSSAYTYNFSTGTGSTDNTSPTVTNMVPASNATGVSLTSSVTITFSENIVSGDNYSEIYIKNMTTGKTVTIASKNISGNTLTIKQASSRLNKNTYQVYLPAGAVKDSAGNSLSSAYIYQFQTG